MRLGRSPSATPWGFVLVASLVKASGRCFKVTSYIFWTVSVSTVHIQRKVRFLQGHIQWPESPWRHGCICMGELMRIALSRMSACEAMARIIHFTTCINFLKGFLSQCCIQYLQVLSWCLIVPGILKAFVGGCAAVKVLSWCRVQLISLCWCLDCLP